MLESATTRPGIVFSALTMKSRLVGCLIGPFLLVASGQYNVLTFHGDRQRTGWISSEKLLTPGKVAGGAFGPVWDSPQFDSVTISGQDLPSSPVRLAALRRSSHHDRRRLRR